LANMSVTITKAESNIFTAINQNLAISTTLTLTDGYIYIYIHTEDANIKVEGLGQNGAAWDDIDSPDGTALTGQVNADRTSNLLLVGTINRIRNASGAAAYDYTLGGFYIG